MAATTIKDGFQGGSDNQALVDSAGNLHVTGTFTPGPGTGNVNLIQVGGAAFTLGPNVMANSLPVTIASDQTPIPTTNLSVGLDGATAPTYSTQIGAQNSSGNLVALSVDPLGRLLVDTTGTSTITGTVNANINGLNDFETTQYLVGTTPIQITIPTGTSSMSIKAKTSTMTDAVLVGGTGSVSNAITGTGNGYFLFYGDSLQLDLTPTASVWVVGTSAGQIICVLFVGD